MIGIVLGWGAGKSTVVRWLGIELRQHDRMDSEGTSSNTSGLFDQLSGSEDHVVIAQTINSPTNVHSVIPLNANELRTGC